MPTTIANSTAETPTSRLMRAPNMMADSMSRPWSSVPSGKDQSASASGTGGLKLSIRFRLARSNGLCGAIHGASAAARISTAAMVADSTAIGERRKL